jgi:hypothetical protein
MVILGCHELVPWNYEVTFPPHEIDVCATMTPSAKRPLLCAQGRIGFTKWIALCTLLIVAALSEWLDGSWSYSGLLVPNLRFVFKQVARLRRSSSQRHIAWGLLILNKTFALRQVQLRVHISHAKAAENRLAGGHMLLFFFNPRTCLVVQVIILLLASEYAIIGALLLVEFSFINSRKWEIICPVRFVRCV